MFLFRFFGLSISISKIYFFMIWRVNVFVFWLRLSTDAPKLRLQKSNARVLSSNWYLAPMFRLKWKIPSIYINKIYSCKFGKCMVLVACTLGRRYKRRYLTYENVHPGIFIDISWSVFNIHKYKLFQIQFEKQWEIKSQSVLSFCSKKEHLW